MSDIALGPSEAQPAYPLSSALRSMQRSVDRRQSSSKSTRLSRPDTAGLQVIVSSAYKRQGGIIERAFDATAMGNLLRYGGEDYVRTLQVDFLVFDDRSGRLGAYERKRGFGYHDSGKKRSMLRDLRCLEMLMKSYGEQRKMPVEMAEARITLGIDASRFGRTFRRTGH
jgi:hypothetical protein